MPMLYQKRLFSVDEYHQMINVGILKEDDRVELIDGEIISMPPIGPRHASNVDRLTAIFYAKCGNNIIVRVQSPVQLDDSSEPQPDITILKPRADFYETAHPKPEDIFLIIEIADSSMEYDRTYKLPKYAQSNISEVWLFDKQKHRIEVYKRPYNDIYQEIRIAFRGQEIALLNLPDICFSVDELLG